MWPREILDPDKQFNLIICLENVLKISLQDVLKMSWRRFWKMSWKRFEHVMKLYGQDKYIGLDQDVLKASSEDVWVKRIMAYYIYTA